MRLSQHLDNAWCRLRTRGKHRYRPFRFPDDDSVFEQPHCEFCGLSGPYKGTHPIEEIAKMAEGDFGQPKKSEKTALLRDQPTQIRRLP